MKKDCGSPLSTVISRHKQGVSLSLRTVYNHPAFVPHEVVPPTSFSSARSTPPTLGELLFWPIGDFWRLDLGFVNLLCATGLPDTHDLDVRACLATLDEWTRIVARETDRCLHQFRRSPGDYSHSEAFFRALMMVTVIQQDCGARYRADAIKTQTFKSSREGFIHGLLTGDRTGTCANTPVLFAAIGRKLGYPIYIVGAKGHLFNRWHDAKTGERFNIDASGLGMNAHPDDPYFEWPHKITDAEVHHGFYLKNLDPAEELGVFMATRGHCLLDGGHLLDAIVAYSHAHRLMPTDPTMLGFLLDTLNRELDLQKAGKLPTSYRQAEGWDSKIELFRFTLNTRYVERQAGTIASRAHGQRIERN